MGLPRIEPAGSASPERIQAGLGQSRGLTIVVVTQLLIIHKDGFDVNVDAAHQQTGDVFLVAVDG